MVLFIELFILHFFFKYLFILTVITFRKPGHFFFN